MKFDPCDIVFSDSVPILGAVLKIWGEPWGHVSLATGNEDEVIGAEAEGITKRFLHEWEREKHEVLRFTDWPYFDNDYKRVLDWAEAQVGKPIYDFLQLLVGFPLGIDLHTQGWWVCSSFIYEDFRQAGIYLLKRTQAWEVRPQHLYRTTALESV